MAEIIPLNLICWVGVGGWGVGGRSCLSVYPQPSFCSLSIYPCGDLLAVGGSEMPGVGDRRGRESQHSVKQPERRQIAPIKRQAASSDLTSASVSRSGDRDKFSLSIRVRNQQECLVKNESSSCLERGCYWWIASQKEIFGLRCTFFFLLREIFLPPQQVNEIHSPSSWEFVHISIKLNGKIEQPLSGFNHASVRENYTFTTTFCAGLIKQTLRHTGVIGELPAAGNNVALYRYIRLPRAKPSSAYLMCLCA